MTRDAEIDPALVARFDQVTATLESKEGEYRDQRVRSQQDNLHRLQAAVQELETRAASESLSLKDAEKILKDTKLVVGTMGPLPTKQDREDLTVRLQAVRTAVGPRIKELRDAEEWKRWANVQVQEELCAKMEALIPQAEAEPEKAATEMRALQEKWKSVAAAPRSQAETLWTRFKAAQDQVYDKCKDFFAQQAAERQENLKKKEALVVSAEALAGSSDWVRTADAIKQLQAEWKAIGPVTRGYEKAVWERFRSACDKFFTRRQEDLKERKHEWSDNLTKKEALIAEAEQLAQSTEWDKAAGRIKQLQASGRRSARSSARTSPKSSGSASVRRVTRSSSATRRAIRWPFRARWRTARPRSPSSRRWCRRRMRPTRRCPRTCTPRCRPLVRATCRVPSCPGTC
jgi:hypothetical protein